MRIKITLVIFAAALCSCSQQTAIPAFRSIGANAMPARAQAASLKNKRLFVSDAGSGSVYLYDVPSLKLVAILQGFSSPQGECANDKGDVWVADNRADEIYELSYGGRTENHLSDTTGHPVGCAWDSTTGNLAVTNYLGVESSSGAVLVYRHANGSPTAYTNHAQFSYGFAGYDTAGNLFFDGANAQGKFTLSELPSKGQTAHTIQVSGATIDSAGMVQWDPASNYLDVGDQNCGKTATSCLYQLQLSGKHATVVNKIALQNYAGSQVCDMVQGVIADGRLFGSDDDYCGYADSATYGWSYPAGGSPSKHLTKGVSKPIGATLATNPAAGADFNPKNLDLLYISEAAGDVAVYTYWQKTLVRHLQGFSNPQGECVDKNNDVYVTDAGSDDIVEYAHDGSKPLRTIDDSPYVPYACAIDFATGNLAVANESGQTGSGNIAIYAKASGTPTILTDAAISEFGACVYDNQGNLLATNISKYEGTSHFAWLPAGGAKLVNISIPGPYSYTWEGVQGLQWDGRYYVIDIYDGVIRIAIQNDEAYYVGETGYDNELDIFGPGWIYDTNPKKQGTQYVGLYIDRSVSKYDAVAYLNYPAGNSVSFLEGIGRPNAVAVSLGKIHE
jgi:hypothetical protein